MRKLTLAERCCGAERAGESASCVKNLRLARGTSLVVVGLVVAAVFFGGLRVTLAADQTANPSVFAKIGNHEFTQQDVDDAVLRGVSPSQLYNLRKQALDRLVDQYLI